MFDDISDDELEVQTEASDELIDETLEEEDQKKPGPLEVWMTMIYYVSRLNYNMQATRNAYYLVLFNNVM